MTGKMPNPRGQAAGNKVENSSATSKESQLKDKYFICSDDSRDELTHDYYEYEQGDKDIIVRGRLRQNIAFWKYIGCNNFIIDTIFSGYKIPFFSSPTQSKASNKMSSIKEYSFQTEAIQNLLFRDLIEKCDHCPYVINPLSVSVRDNGKTRLILVLRIVNKHIWKHSFKYDDMKIALSYLDINQWMIKYDIHSAYHLSSTYKISGVLME